METVELPTLSLQRSTSAVQSPSASSADEPLSPADTVEPSPKPESPPNSPLAIKLAQGKADHAASKKNKEEPPIASFPVALDGPQADAGGRVTLPGIESLVFKKLFGTAASDMVEEDIPAKLAKYVVHPTSVLRRNWDSVAFCLVVYTVIVLPVRTAFFWEKMGEQSEESQQLHWDFWLGMDVTMDLFFCCDILLNFFTGYYTEPDEVLVMDPKDIWFHYIRGWFVIDVFASVPLDLLLTGNHSVLWRLPRILKALRLSRLLRLLRFSRILRYGRRLPFFQKMKLSTFTLRICKLFVCELTFSHWNACIQWLVVAIEEFPKDSWVEIMGLRGSPRFEQYSWAFFRALSHMLCIGYGQEPPLSLSEAWTINVSMMCGASLFAVFVGIITTLLIQIDTSTALYNSKIEMVNQYMAHRRLPLELRDRIRASYDARWKSQRVFEEHSILHELPISLRTEVCMFNCQDLLESVPFFNECEAGLVSTVVTLLEPLVVLTGDVMIRTGETAREMYFIRLGEVSISLDDQVITYLSQGSYFGEIALLLTSHRVADVAATKNCELYSLKRDDFSHVFKNFPEAHKAINKIAQHRHESLKWHVKSHPKSGMGQAIKKRTSVLFQLENLENRVEEEKAKREVQAKRERAQQMRMRKKQMRQDAAAGARPSFSRHVKSSLQQVSSFASAMTKGKADDPARALDKYRVISRTRSRRSSDPHIRVPAFSAGEGMQTDRGTDSQGIVERPGSYPNVYARAMSEDSRGRSMSERECGQWHEHFWLRDMELQLDAVKFQRRFLCKSVEKMRLGIAPDVKRMDGASIRSPSGTSFVNHEIEGAMWMRCESYVPIVV
ncbi:hypothetical protein CYMTET_40621 [Cymbomonas tetramitiformis]|uniref:Cyclic nucleotide-binding domain-containing protein n=1 Tax=Cymbomonas tetramitiformis TaxID=36881 RepID=A0AAE0C9H5_9CHLO|nr:hypothetical protein CYMTET_40621 [Cymbomonas tetramitiformis]